MTATAPNSSEIDLSELTRDALFFPTGLVGCEDWKHFVLIENDEVELPLARLQSLDDARIALIVTSPNQIDPRYAAPVSVEDRAELDLGEGVEPVVYCTLSVGSDGWLTANLLGPLVVNPASRRGKQLVLVESGYSTQHRVSRLTPEEGTTCSS
jgi:flagellar assembly factor FliW